ncbi:unnamed protein product, partial [Aphanomyces euteiches]
HGDTPLHLTSFHGNLEIVKELLAHGASIEAANADTDTPLHLAAWNGHFDIIKEFMAHGNTIHAANK